MKPEEVLPPGVDAEHLPEDPTLLQSIIRELIAQVKRLLSLNEQQAFQIEKLIRARYGPRADRFAPGQGLLFDLKELLDLKAQAEAAAREEAAAEAAAQREEEKAKSKRKGHGRNKFPAHLPRERIYHDLKPEEKVCKCCGELMTCIGEEVSERCEYVPATLKVIEDVQLKYACRKEACNSKVYMLAKPAQPIEKGLPGPGLLAHVITSKYADHLPLNRQEGIFARNGFEISRSTLCGWMAAAADLLVPIYALMKSQVLMSRVIMTDDTPVSVLGEKRRGTGEVLEMKLVMTKTGRIWVYAGDRDHPHTVFDYSPNHKQEWPVKFLGGYTGYLQADAYKGYDIIYAGGKVIELGCWAHARRYYSEAQIHDPGRAATMEGAIRLLYDVERDAKDMSDEERYKLRQQRSKPILDIIEVWLKKQQLIVLPKSPMGEAIGYTLSNWVALNRYLEAGYFSIDNNDAERALRSIAVGRGNWMFYGSDRGGRTGAILSSFVATCKRHEVDPFAYLRDVLDRISTHPQKRIEELLPHRWKALREGAGVAGPSVATATSPDPPLASPQPAQACT